MAEHTTTPALRRIARLLAWLTLATAVLVFVGGWMVGVVALRNVIPGTVGMKALTALGLAASAVALLVVSAQRPSIAARVLGAAAAAFALVLGAAVLGEYVLGVDLRIDELLFKDSPGRAMGIAHPGRFAPTTALCLILIGGALLLADARPRRGWRPSEILVIPVAFMACLSVVGYLYEIPIFYGPHSAAKMAINTAVCFAALSVAVLFARPRGRLVDLATTEGPGGVMIRRVTPVIVVLPTLLGWASLQVDETGFLNHRVATWIVSAITIAGLIVLISRVAARLGADSRERSAAQHKLALSEELYRLTITNLPGATVGLYDRDLRCRLLHGQRANAALSAEQARGKRLADFAGQRVADDLEPAMRKALDGHETEMEYQSPDGSRISHFQITPFRNDENEIDGVLIVSADITEQRRAQQAEREVSERFEAAFAQAPIGIATVDLDGRFLQANDALCALTGYSTAELMQQEPFALLHPDDRAGAEARFATLGRDTDSLATEHRIRHADGRTVWIDQRVTLIRSADGHPSHALAQLLDITERRGYEIKLQHLADHDALTGLLNRRGFIARIEEHIAHVRRYGTVGALLMVDLDGFKLVNDTFGHSIGDELIVAVSDAIKHRLRGTDVIARLGGDEFAVILPRETPEQALQVAQALVDVVRERAASLRADPAGHVTASIGVAVFGPEMTARDLLIRGDLAMYDAKQCGKNRVAAYADGESTKTPAAVAERNRRLRTIVH